MGVYRRVEQLYLRGRPVYKHRDRDGYIHNGCKTGRWVIGSDYNVCGVWLQSAENGKVRIEILGLNWQYKDGDKWITDYTSKVE